MKTQIHLKTLISQVIATLMPQAVLKYSFFINDVSSELQLTSNEALITAEIKKLLLQELLQTTEACIRISAAVQNDQLQLIVHNKGSFCITS